MRNINILILLAAAVLTINVNSEAQFSIPIPKIPKVKKEKPSEPTPAKEVKTNSTTEASDASGTQDLDNAPWDDIPNPAYLSERDTVKEVLKQVRAYTPGSGKRIVSGSGYEYDWFNAAISPKFRAEKMSTWTNLQPKYRNWFDAKLDEIGRIASEKLDSYLPNPSLYTVRNPAEERLMKAALSTMPGIAIHKIGLESSVWTIAKNALDIPINRFKYGIVYGKNPSADDRFCEVWYVNIIQDYAGGGTWGSSYAKWVRSETFGCPKSK